MKSLRTDIDMVSPPRPRKIRWLATIIAFFAVTLSVGVMSAQTVTVTMQDGTSTDVSYNSGTLKKRYVQLNSGERLEYAKISEIATSNFDAYEQAVKRTSRRDNMHITVRYTGEGDVNLLRLEKLERKRAGAGTAQGAGGILMLLGALSGDEDVYSAGLVTYGAGSLAKDWNTDATIEVQNQALRELHAKQAQLEKADSLEDQFRIEYGDENVDGLIALIENNHTRALALANAGETSDDANYRMWAVWLKAVIYADQGDREALEKEYARLIVLDPEVPTVEEADRWMELLLKDLEELRQG